jgi:hypothetical protein
LCLEGNRQSVAIAIGCGDPTLQVPLANMEPTPGDGFGRSLGSVLEEQQVAFIDAPTPNLDQGLAMLPLVGHHSWNTAHLGAGELGEAELFSGESEGS